MKGLIYFADDFGYFPAQKPAYETAFVFVDDGSNNYEVPPWAIKLVLQKEEINSCNVIRSLKESAGNRMHFTDRMNSTNV